MCNDAPHARSRSLRIVGSEVHAENQHWPNTLCQNQTGQQEYWLLYININVVVSVVKNTAFVFILKSLD